MLTGILFPIIILAIGGGIVFTIIQRNDETVDRAAAVRRLYFYLVSLISYITALYGLDGILRTLADVWLDRNGLYTINADRDIREQLARTVGFLLVATLIFLFTLGLCSATTSTSLRSEFSTAQALSLCWAWVYSRLCAGFGLSFALRHCRLGVWAAFGAK